MSDALNIENHAELVAYLRQRRYLDPAETPVCRTLAGGVSNRTVLVRRSDGAGWVLKQALAKLRVAVDWFSDPRRIHREAAGLRWLDQLAPGRVPAFLFEDPTCHVLAMQAVPEPHENWKSVLLAGRVVPDHARQFGELLGTIHRRSHERLPEVAAAFGDRSYFESLRVEPYYLYTATQVPEAAEFVRSLVDETRATSTALVHGDFSPKNVLLHDDRLVLLDHEVVHCGDPAFDVGFALAHLLSKAHHLPRHREAFCSAGLTFWEAYVEGSTTAEGRPSDDDRAARHALGCLLARAAGRSPLEYLDIPARARQRSYVVGLLQAPPANVPELIDRWNTALQTA